MNNCSFDNCNFSYDNSYELYEHINSKHDKYSICGRCLDGHGYIEIILIEELFEDEYFIYLCDECHGYILENN